MSIRTKLSVLGMAEADCAQRRAAITAAWRGLKYESERAATPGRIVGAGLAAGFLSGLPGSVSKGSGFAIGDKLFSAVLQGAIASIGAAFTTEAAAADFEEGVAAAESHSVADHGG